MKKHRDSSRHKGSGRKASHASKKAQRKKENKDKHRHDDPACACGCAKPGAGGISAGGPFGKSKKRRWR